MRKDFGLDLGSLPKELLLMLYLLERTTEQKFQLKNEWINNINWDEFVQLVMHHRVYPIIYLRLRDIKDDQIPKEIIHKLHQAYYANTIQMLQLSGEMGHICSLFQEKNVQCLLLKGPAVAVELYGDISQRTSRDLDILVQEGQLDSVDAILTGNGYVKEKTKTVLREWRWRGHHETYIHPQKGITLEIHWRLHPFPSKEPSFEELWERKRKSSVSSRPMYCLGREDLLLFLIGHGAREGWFRLRWLLDIDYALKSELNWEKLNGLIKKDQYEQVVGQSLILAAQLLKTPVPEQLSSLTDIKRSRRLAQEALGFTQQMVELHSPQLNAEIAKKYSKYQISLKSRCQKALFLLSILYPSTKDLETLELPKHLHFLYFPLRPVLWAWRKTKKHAYSMGAFK